MGSWPGKIGAITLFVEDLAAMKRFYQEVFGLPVHFADDASAVFDFGNTLINLLNGTEAPELIEPAVGHLATPAPGSSSRSTLMTWTPCAPS